MDDSEYVTTTYTFDGANQLVSSTCDGVTTRYAYDAAGRLVKEGDRTYRYGFLDKVLSVTDGKRSYAYAYHVDGQLARADYGDGRSEGFAWDGLALVRRGDESFVNEPHAGGGNPVVSSRGATYFNDALGTTVGVREGRGASRKGAKRRYTAAALTAFGEPALTQEAKTSKHLPSSFLPLPLFFTGKPQVEGLGRVFLYRNYRADLAKWQTSDPLGYPDGWNQLAYCGNGVTSAVDLFGAHTIANEEFGYTSSLGLGCWYRLVAECTENYENLYTVNMAYQYEAKDPDTGENKIYTGHLSLPVQNSKHIVLHCYHRKME